jgi:hypothetical protein
MSTEQEFVTNHNTLLVVNAYIEAFNSMTPAQQIELVQDTLNHIKPIKAAVILNMPLPRIYDYRRKDWVERRADNCKINLLDFINIMVLRDNLGL